MGVSVPSLLIESTDTMIEIASAIYAHGIIICHMYNRLMHPLKNVVSNM